MVSMNVPSKVPITLARVALFNGDLERAAQAFNPQCVKLEIGLGNSVKYALYQQETRPYLLMVSQQTKKEITVVQGVSYDCILTVSSRYSDLNAEMAREFQAKSGIDFRDAPSKFAEFMQGVGLSLIVFERHGQKAMDILKGMR
jgi:hypothetical protein